MSSSDIHKSFAVFGLSKFGFHTAVSLFELGAKVIAIDKSESIVQHISSKVDKAVCADLLDWESIEHVGGFDVDVVIIGLREAFEATVLIVNHLKTKTRIKKVIALVDSEEKAGVLRIMGIDRVIFPEQEAASGLVQRLTIPNLINEIPVTSDTRIIEINCPSEFLGKSLMDLKIRSKYKVSIISIVRGREGEKPVILISPDANLVFESTDKIVCLGNSKNLIEFSKTFEVT